MGFEVDTSGAPALLRVRCFGDFPSVEEQSAVRERLIAAGLLTDGTVSLLDVRDLDEPDPDTMLKSIAAALRAGIPKRRAVILNPGKHLALLQQFQAAVPEMPAAAFLNEREALEWLLNPGGAVGSRP